MRGWIRMMGSKDYFGNETKKLSAQTVVQQEVTATNTNSMCVDIVKTIKIVIAQSSL